MKKLFICVLFLFSTVCIFATTDCTNDEISVVPTENKTVWQTFLKPYYILDVTIEPGIAVYLGLFRQRLENEGAYILTPTFDVYLSLYILRYFGMQAMFSSGCVIHPRSTPIEGTLLYMAIEAFGQYEWKYVLLKAFAGVGYEHPTWLIEQYASGFFEGGVGIGIKVTNYLAITTSCKYRMGFLHIVQLYPERLMSLTISAGVTFRIANRL